MGGVAEPGTAVRAPSGAPVLIGDIVATLRRGVTEVAEVTDETRDTVGIVIMMEITTEIETVRDTDTEMIPLAVIEVRDILTEMTTVTENTELHHTQGPQRHHQTTTEFSSGIEYRVNLEKIFDSIYM